MISVNKFSEKDWLDVKSVFVYFHGSFPKHAYPIKDTSLPRRMFPNANKFYIRCKKTLENTEYFSKLYSGKNDLGEDIEIKLINDQLDIAWKIVSKDIDVMYMPWVGFDGYQKNLGKHKEKFHKTIHEFRKPIYLFVNDPSNSSFFAFSDYLSRPDVDESRFHWFKPENELYEHVKFVPNDTPFTKATRGKYWWSRHFSKISDRFDINVAPLSDIIIYDLPKSHEVLLPKMHEDYSKRRGIWVGTCFEERSNYINLVFTDGILDFRFMGRGTEKFELYSNKNADENNVENRMLPGLFKSHDYSIYFSRGKFVNMLGATFYEPLLHGLPLFLSKVCDPYMEIFPDIPECYWENEWDLKRSVDSVDMEDLWLRQIRHLFG